MVTEERVWKEEEAEEAEEEKEVGEEKIEIILPHILFSINTS